MRREWTRETLGVETRFGSGSGAGLPLRMFACPATPTPNQAQSGHPMTGECDRFERAGRGASLEKPI